MRTVSISLEKGRLAFISNTEEEGIVAPKDPDVSSIALSTTSRPVGSQSIKTRQDIMTLRRVFRLAEAGEKQSPSADEALNKAPPAEATRIRIITHNIRYATSAPFKGEELWPIRCPRLCSELVFNSVVPATFICLQEVLREQLLDIRDSLNESLASEWAYIGVGRDDGRERGEYSPIFYRPSIWKLDRWDTIWLSETPRVPSKGWDASSTRIATMGQFIHTQTGRRVLVTNTHFDNDGVESRRNSAKMLPEILELEAELSGGNATFLVGDFNSSPSDEAYQIVTGEDSNMVDVLDLVPKAKRYGNEDTFTGFSDDDNPDRIDFIFARKFDIGERFKFHAFAVLPNLFDDGVFSSDHRAVVADCHLN